MEIVIINGESNHMSSNCHVCIFSKLDDPIIVIARAYGNSNAETSLLKHWSWGIPVYSMFFLDHPDLYEGKNWPMVFLIFSGWERHYCIICSHRNQSLSPAPPACETDTNFRDHWNAMKCAVSLAGLYKLRKIMHFPINDMEKSHVEVNGELHKCTYMYIYIYILYISYLLLLLYIYIHIHIKYCQVFCVLPPNGSDRAPLKPTVLSETIPDGFKW